MQGFDDIVKTGKRYEIIYADPPWPYNDSGIRGGVAKHYDTMTLDEIKSLPVESIAADNAFLFLWITNPMLPHAFDVIKAWGFQYKTIAFTWIKVNKMQRLNDYLIPGGISDFMGCGHYTRANSENCLLGVRGDTKRLKGMILNRGVRSTVFAYRSSRHSEKPGEVRKRIILLLGDRSRIELFSRHVVPGWDYWGMEVNDE